MLRSIILLLTGFTALSFTSSKKQDDYLKRQKVLHLAKTYAPDGYTILKKNGDFRFEKYVDGTDQEEILDDFNTVIHESCHHLNGSIDRYNPETRNWDESYFITTGLQIVVPKMRVYNSRLLNEFVPDSLHTKIFRYNTYVGGNIMLISSQVSGIYGLLDEFCAYYHGSKAGLELYEYYKKDVCNGFENKYQWTTYLSNVSATLYAYYEFKLFMSWYLQYAKLKQPDVYKDCFDNTQLRLAYTLLDNEFGALVDKYYQVQAGLLVDLNKTGDRVEINENESDYFMEIYKPDGSMIGRGIHEKDMVQLRKLLAQPEHHILQEFRLEGATVDNYHSYQVSYK